MAYVIIPQCFEKLTVMTCLYKYSVKINRFCSKNSWFLMILPHFITFTNFSPDTAFFHSLPAQNLRLKVSPKCTISKGHTPSQTLPYVRQKSDFKWAKQPTGGSWWLLDWSVTNQLKLNRPFSYCIDQAGLGAFTAKSGRKHYIPLHWPSCEWTLTLTRYQQ